MNSQIEAVAVAAIRTVERAFRPASPAAINCRPERALARERSVVRFNEQDVSPAKAGSISKYCGVDAGLKARSTCTPRQSPEGVEQQIPRRPEGLLGVTIIRTLYGAAKAAPLQIAACTLLLGCLAAAQNITGTVINGTTGKPAAGDEVTLLSLSQGMQEIGHAKTDAQGHFSFAAPADAQAPHMVRVTHDGVGYFPQGGPLMPGRTTAELTVYDATKKVDGVSQTVEVNRLQSDGKQLEAITLYALNNKSQPPRTLANDKGTFEVVLPEGGEIDSAQARGPGGQPIATEALPGSQKGHFLLTYPVRPGETQFQVSYHMPYAGEASFSPKALRDVQHFVVMLPKGMNFNAKDAKQFQQMTDPQSVIMVATNVKPGEELSYRVSGSGIFPAENQQGGQEGGDSSGAMGSQAATNDNRPGGGLGAPIDAPDPLHAYRPYILGGFALVLVMGGAYIVSRSNHPQLIAPTAGAAGAPGPHGATAGAGNVKADSAEAAAAFADFVEPTASSRDRNALLLEAMKEELFQLEVDRQQGKVSPEEYTKAKAALDETIRRAVARKSS